MTVLDSVKRSLLAAHEQEQHGNLEDALRLYERAAELDARSWPTCCSHARALYALGRAADAEKLLSEYLQVAQPAPAAAHNDLGVIKAERGNRRAAIKCFAEALQLPCPTSSSDVLSNLAYLLYADNRLDECAKACDNALRINPDETRAHFILSMVEGRRYEARLRPVAKIAREGTRVQVFRLLRWDGQEMAKHEARISREDDPQVDLIDPAPLARPGTFWGILAAPKRTELWCGFSRQAKSEADTDITMPLATEFVLVQRRRWVRMLVADAVTRIEIRSFPQGTTPFEVVKLFQLNLSAGGAAVRTMPELPMGTEVTLFLKLDHNEILEVPARVIRIARPETSEAYSALAFANIQERDRERIAHYIHNIQLARRRAGHSEVLP